MNTVKFQDITVTSSTIGEVSGFELKVFLNTLFRMLIPFANHFLASGFDMPRKYFGMVEIKSANFIPQEGFVTLAFVPQFI